jgi:hypothetical protein
MVTIRRHQSHAILWFSEKYLSGTRGLKIGSSNTPAVSARGILSASTIVCEGRGDHAKERETMFYAIFWTTYVPFVLLSLSVLAERLTHHAEDDAPPRTKPVAVLAEPSNRAHKDASTAR